MERRTFFRAALGGVAAVAGIAKIAPHVEAEQSPVIERTRQLIVTPHEDGSYSLRKFAEGGKVTVTSTPAAGDSPWLGYCEQFVETTITNLRPWPPGSVLSWDSDSALYDLASQGESHYRTSSDYSAPLRTASYGAFHTELKPSGDLVDW